MNAQMSSHSLTDNLLNIRSIFKKLTFGGHDASTRQRLTKITKLAKDGD